ncbi:MAG: matrixin family metalloprotease [Proteobacteria bacterium]|nr:MAG: matrixin family metalloprotease [Pseudomonadota bacterium]
MNTTRGPILLLSLLFPLVNACGGKVPSSNDHPKSNFPEASKFFVHGDPEELIADSVQDKSGFSDASNYARLDQFTMVGRVEFAELIEKAKVDRIANHADLEARNSTNSESETKSLQSDYAFTQEGKSLLYRDTAPDHENYPVFKFDDEGGKLVLSQIDGESVEPVHYSMKNNGEAMSFLVRSKGEEGTVLSAFYFVKLKPLKLMPRFISALENYFLAGDGTVINWKSEINLSVCGKNRAKYKTSVDQAIAAWSEAGAFDKGFIGKNAYTVKVNDKAFPFNDLNQNCINFIDRYKNEDQENFITMGVTLPIYDWSNQSIFSSQIFIFLNATSRSQMGMLSVLTHEMGHLLGLGHEFKSGSNDTALPSIMGYNAEPKITPSDRKAIDYLYAD